MKEKREENDREKKRGRDAREKVLGREGNRLEWEFQGKRVGSWRKNEPKRRDEG